MPRYTLRPSARSFAVMPFRQYVARSRPRVAGRRRFVNSYARMGVRSYSGIRRGVTNRRY